MIENENQYWNERFNDEQHQRNLNLDYYNAAFESCRPSTIYKPRLFIDGYQWCALYGDNVQDGIAGFGKSAAEAYSDFDVSWNKKIERGEQ